MLVARKPDPTMHDDHDAMSSGMHGHASRQGQDGAAKSTSARRVRWLAATAAAWASTFAVAVFCGTFLIADQVDHAGNFQSSADVGFESIGPGLAMGTGQAGGEQGRTPHNLYRFSGARAAVASMAHGL